MRSMTQERRDVSSRAPTHSLNPTQPHVPRLVYLVGRAQVSQPVSEGEAELGRVERGEHRLGARS